MFFVVFSPFNWNQQEQRFHLRFFWGQQFSNFIVHQVLFKHFWCTRSGVTFGMCICDKFLGSADAAGLDNTLLRTTAAK